MRRGHGPVRIGVLPGALVPGVELGHAHPGRLKDHVLGVVEFPVLGENAPFAFQTLVEGCSGEGRHDRVARQVNAGLHGKSGRFEKHLGRVVVQAEGEASHQADVMPVQGVHHGAVIVWAS